MLRLAVIGGSRRPNCGSEGVKNRLIICCERRVADGVRRDQAVVCFGQLHKPIDGALIAIERLLS
jgi:hypothetical protein